MRKTVVVNQSLATSAQFTVNLMPLVHFLPTQVIIRQILYANIAGTDNGTYLLWSNVQNSYIGAFYVGIQGVGLMPESTFSLTSPLPSIDFRVDPANAAFTGPTGQFTMVMEFVRE